MKSMSRRTLKRATQGPRANVLAGALALAGLAATAADVFTGDTTPSRVTVSGNVTGAPVQEQGPGSLTTGFGGTLYLEQTANSIQFADGSRVFAMDSGTWQPLPDGGSGGAAANYGGMASDSFSTGFAAVRQAELNVHSGVLAVANGRFDSRPVTFVFPAAAAR